jgi:hypothetical protein
VNDDDEADLEGANFKYAAVGDAALIGTAALVI